MNAELTPSAPAAMSAIRELDSAGRLGPPAAIDALTVDGELVRQQQPDSGGEATWDANGISLQRSAQGFVRLREIEQYREELIALIPTDEFYARVKKVAEDFETYFAWNPEDDVIDFGPHVRKVHTYLRNDVGGSSNYWWRLYTQSALTLRYVWGPIPEYTVGSYPLEVVRDADNYTVTLEDHALVFGESDGLFLSEVIDVIKAQLRQEMLDAGRPGWDDFGVTPG